MFVSFDESFKNEDGNLEIPSIVQDYLSLKLPEGVRYRFDSNGNYEIISENEKIKFGGFKLKISKEIKDILGDEYSFDNVLKYAYNAQISLPIVENREGYITVNGQEIEIEKLNNNIFKPSTYKKHSFKIFPYSFPKPEPAVLAASDNEYEFQLMIHRIPNKSLHVMKYCSEEDSPLYLEFSVDEATHIMNTSLKIYFDKAKSIKELVSAISIYNSFIQNKGIFNSVPLKNKGLDNSINGKLVEQSVVEFWKKVLLIELKLGISLGVPNDDITYGVAKKVETLYQTLINQNPIKIRQNNVVLTMDKDAVAKEFDELENKKMCFFYFEELKLDLFGTNINLFGLTALFNCKVGKKKREKDNVKISFEDFSEEEKLYASKLYFLTDEELKTYSNNMDNSKIDFLSKAQTIEFYMELE